MRPNPTSFPNAEIFCESKTYALDSKCYLECDPGFIPFDQVSTTCTYDKKSKDFVWDVEDAKLQCIAAVGLVIGGIKQDYRYTNEVEVFAPGFKCKYPMLAPYPHEVIGTSSGFTLGLNIVCGGALYEYVNCKKHAEGSNDCKTGRKCF